MPYENPDKEPRIVSGDDANLDPQLGTDDITDEVAHWEYELTCSQCGRSVWREALDGTRGQLLMFVAEGWAKSHDGVCCGSCRGIFPWKLERLDGQVVLSGPDHKGNRISYVDPFESMYLSGMPAICPAAFVRSHSHEFATHLIESYFDSVIEKLRKLDKYPIARRTPRAVAPGFCERNERHSADSFFLRRISMTIGIPSQGTLERDVELAKRFDGVVVIHVDPSGSHVIEAHDDGTLWIRHHLQVQQYYAETGTDGTPWFSYKGVAYVESPNLRKDFTSDTLDDVQDLYDSITQPDLVTQE